jgi:Family of unknown function (DUF6090)
MIKFFRKIRHKLLTTGKTANYFKYAFGEIILVVIGILIALQVNNWNEERKFKKEGNRIQKELYYEFTDNRTVIKERIQVLENANQSIRTVLNYVNANEETINKVNMDSLISSSLKYGNYNPSNSTIQELIGSGRLNLIDDKSLKKNLYNWLQLLKDSDEDFKNQDQQATIFVIPYLNKHISIKNLNVYNNMGIVNESELFSKVYFDMFHDLEFENLYQNKLFWNIIMVNHYKDLDDLAVKIMSQSKIQE